MKKAILSFVFLLISFGLVSAYTQEDVTTHNTPEDCWMIFENGVYDISTYLEEHDEYLDIREWCGKDMTEDFKTKADQGGDHKPGSYTLLEEYRIGDLEEVVVVVSDTAQEEEVVVDTESDPVESPKEKRGYNLVVPLLISVLSYWSIYFLVKKGVFFGVTLRRFNGFWNSIMFLMLLVPALGFGIFMMIRSKKPELWNIDFDFLYWHVELSLVMGLIAVNHFIQRFSLYIKQIGK